MTKYEQPTVSVVIPTWNRQDDILECLQSIFKSNYSFINVIVIDNGSTDDTVNNVRRDFPQVNLIQLEKNYGASFASNIGINRAIEENSDFILRLDSDVIIDNQMILESLIAAQSRPEVGAVFPKIYRYDNPDIIWYTGARKNRLLLISKVQNYNVKDGNQYDSLEAIDYAPSAAILIKTDVLRQLNGFDEDFFVYSEDFDLCLRMRNLGKIILFCPSSKAWHKIGSEKLSKSGVIQFYKSKLIFYRKHSKGLHLVFLLFYTFFYITYRSITRFPNEPWIPGLQGIVLGIKYNLKNKK